jgi:uncharacterized protein (TIGR02646 family)
MIKLQKNSCPPEIQSKLDSLKQEILELIDSDMQGTDEFKKTLKKYNQPGVKDIIKKECLGKCMYCERKVSSYGHIEHIKPKSIFPEKTFDWDNLGFVCERCNIKKSDYYDNERPIINPYRDEPFDYLTFIGVIIKCSNGIDENDKGNTTIEKINLNSSSLMEERKENNDKIELSLINLKNPKLNESEREVIKEGIEKLFLKDKCAFSFCAREYYKLKINDE